MVLLYRLETSIKPKFLKCCPTQRHASRTQTVGWRSLKLEHAHGADASGLNATNFEEDTPCNFANSDDVRSRIIGFTRVACFLRQ